ncbi:MAG TPA: methyl-accepting chemotaxis protein [Rhodocyclaceae bacterium]|nr:methyl-accepting chemotaxis protein [Rhodocyclaceae bacterium]
MTIAKRLYLLICLTIAGSLAAGGIQLFLTDKVYDAANFANENTVPALEALGKVTGNFSKQRLWIYRHVLAKDPAHKKDFQDKIKEAEAARDEAFKTYEATVTDDKDRQLLTAELALAKEYDQGMQEVIKLSNEGSDQALDVLLKQGVVGEKLNATVEQHIAYNQSLGKQGAATAVATKTSARNIAIAIIAVAALAAFVVATLIIRSISLPVGEVVAGLNQLAQGNLAVSLTPGGRGEIAQLKDSLRTTVAKLRQTLQDIVEQADIVASSSGHLSTAARQVAVSSQQQSQSTSSAAAAVEELTVSIDHVGATAEDASERANEAGAQAASSGTEVDSASSRIREVAQQVEHTAQQIQSLSEQVQRIGNVTVVIREVADQTNLLALNAAIEAARAGEQGRGFAVVADEVRKLAERTTQSVQEIAGMITTIQDGAATAVHSMQASQTVVGDVVETAGRASQSMAGIRASSDSVQHAIAGISDALREQRSASNGLSKDVESIAQMSEENSAAVASVAETANQLVAVSDRLKSSVSQFRL